MYYLKDYKQQRLQVVQWARERVVQKKYMDISSNAFFEKIIGSVSLLIASNILIEQYKQFLNNSEMNDSHIEWWDAYILNEELRENLFSLESYADIYEIDEEKDTSIQFTVELTTKCNAHCKFCNHEQVMQNKIRPNKEMNILDVYYSVNKLKILQHSLRIQNKKIKIYLCGFGESLLHSHFLEAVRYVRRMFPNSALLFNTNGTLLTPALFDKICDEGVDWITFSLCYFNKKNYSEQVLDGMYERTIENLVSALKKRDRTTILNVHIMDNTLNSKEDREEFMRFTEEIKAACDRREIRHFTDNMVDLLQENPEQALREFQFALDDSGNIIPCYQPYTSLTIDVEGNFIPCCIGLWKEKDKGLILGTIHDSVGDIINKLLNLRNNHKKGCFGNCAKCTEILGYHVKKNSSKVK